MRVAVVGTGSTAAQLVPAIAPSVARLYLFQREPGWLLPKGAREFTPKERARYMRFPLLIKINRLRQAWWSMKVMGAFDTSSRRHRTYTDLSVAYLEKAVEDVNLRSALRPTYPWGCKRLLLDDNFYPALSRHNVELVPHAVESVTPRGVVDATGEEREIDILIMATGFQPTRFLASLEVRGPGGRRIQELWGDSEAFLGLTVAGLPNFFMLYGPNTNGGGSIIPQLERQAEVVARTASRMKRKRLKAVDTRESLQRRYVRWVDRRIEARGSAWSAGCHNYFHSEAGRNVTQLPFSSFGYWLLCRMLPRFGLVEYRGAPGRHDRQTEREVVSAEKDSA